MRIVLIVMFIITSMILRAQTSYQITSSVTLNNEDCELSKVSIVLPVPQNNNYQDVTNFKCSAGELLPIEGSGNQYLRELKTFGLLSKGDSYSLTENFDITLYPMFIDMDQFKTIHPYDTQSELYKKYTLDKGEYIDTHNPRIVEVSNMLWNESKGNIIDYARLCYEHVGANYRYLNPNTGIHKIADILSTGGGDCGNLSSIFVNLLRAKQIPARQIVTVRPNGTFHVWADFYLERYGWIPVDVDMKLEYPEGNYFGYCKGDGVVMSSDICHDVEIEPGRNFNATILQNFLYWYWASSGTKMAATHKVKGRQVDIPAEVSISNVRSSKAMLAWGRVKGAKGYRIRLYKKGYKTPVQTKTLKATETNVVLRNLKSETEYLIQFIPLRQVGNITTQMNTSSVHFKTL